jgi:hypothetical protein
MLDKEKKSTKTNGKQNRDIPIIKIFLNVVIFNLNSYILI